MSALDNIQYKLYWIHHKNHSNPKIEGYIGVTSKEITDRFKQHLKLPNNHLKHALNKYGNDIIIDLIGEFDIDLCLLLEQEFRPGDNIGWNITKGGGLPPSHKGKTPNREFIEKRAETRKRNNKPSPLLGKKQDQKSIEKRIETRKRNNKPSPLLGKPKPNDLGEKVSKSLKGRIRSDEHCKNLSISQKGKKLLPESVKKRTETYKKRFESGMYDIGRTRKGKKRGPYKKKEITQ